MSEEEMTEKGIIEAFKELASRKEPYGTYDVYELADEKRVTSLKYFAPCMKSLYARGVFKRVDGKEFKHISIVHDDSTGLYGFTNLDDNEPLEYCG